MTKRQPKSYTGSYAQKKKPNSKALKEIKKAGKNGANKGSVAAPKKVITPKTPAPKKVAVPKKSAKQRAKEFLSNDQKKLLTKYIQEYSSLNVNELKELLAKNRQVKTGSRGELLNRCAEAKLLGGLGNCPKCMGGRLKFNIKTGEYYCKGYMDDEVFKNCSYKAVTGERTKWEE